MNQEIRFPPFNSSLEMQTNCSWKFIAPIDQTIILTFNIIRMDPSNGCKESFIQVFDGPDTNSSQLGGKICGSSNLESMESIGRHLFISYTSLAVNRSDEYRIGINLPGRQNILLEISQF